MNVTTTQLRRDPFARQTLMRITVPIEDRQGCDWCGQSGRFVYYWDSDGRTAPVSLRSPRAYCSVGCYEAYS